MPMMRVLFEDQAGETLGFVAMRWSDRLFFDPADPADPWKATPPARTVAMAPLRPDGAFARFYTGQVDSSAWPDGCYVAFVLDPAGVVRRGGVLPTTIRDGDDAPAFPPTAFTLSIPALSVPVQAK